MMAEITTIKNKITQSVLWNVGLLPARFLIPVISSIIVVRILGPLSYGLLATLGAVISTVEIYSDLGVSKSVPKFIPEIQTKCGDNGLRDFLYILIITRFVLFGGTVLLIFIFSEYFFNFFSIVTNQKEYLYIITAIILLDAPKGVLRGLLISQFRHKDLNILELLNSFVGPLLSIGAAIAGFGVLGILASSAIASLIALILLIRIVLPMLPWKGISITGLRKLGRIFWRRFSINSLSTYMVLATRYFLGPTFVILVMNTLGMRTQVAFFSIAYRSVTLLQNLTTLPLSYTAVGILGNTFLDETHNKLRRSYQTMCRIFLLTVVPASIGLALLGAPILRQLYGNEYLVAVPTLRLLAFFLTLSAIFPYAGSIFQMYEHYKILLMISVISVIITITASYTLIPLFGHTGAAVAVGFGNIFYYLSGTFISHKIFSLRYPIDFALRIFLACTPMLLYFPARGYIELGWGLTSLFIIYSVLAFYILFKLQGGIGATERELLSQSHMPLKSIILRIV